MWEWGDRVLLDHLITMHYIPRFEVANFINVGQSMKKFENEEGGGG